MNLENDSDFLRLGQTFFEEFVALFSDFNDINDGKKEEIKNLSEKFLDIQPNTLKHQQFRVAMFNYMNAIFERNVAELFKLGIIKNSTIRKKYIEKFISLDTERIQKNQKSIRNAEFELMNNEEKMIFILTTSKRFLKQYPRFLTINIFFNK
jgi:hypothetical protein